jgi:Dual OB-containing domain
VSSSGASRRRPGASASARPTSASAAGGWYDFPLTDIRIYERLRQLADGEYARDTVGIDEDSDVFLTVSPSEPYDNDRCYKLVAAVLDVP